MHVGNQMDIKLSKLPHVLNTPRNSSRNARASRKLLGYPLLLVLAAFCFIALMLFTLERRYPCQQLVNEKNNFQEISRAITQLDEIIQKAIDCQTQLKKELSIKNTLDSHMLGKPVSNLNELREFLIIQKERVAEVSFIDLLQLNKMKKSIKDVILEYCHAKEIGSRENPARSCADVPSHSQSGEYWITDANDNPVPVYCTTRPKNWHSNTTGAWMRVAHIDMTDPSHNCPKGFKEIRRNESPHRTCGRMVSHTGCVSTSFPVHGVDYKRVCGRVIGYQVGSPDAFYPHINREQTIDGYYINGISLTHGLTPRQHIWSFAGAVGEHYHGGYESLCPCMNNQESAKNVPLFVGNDFFCDTALRGYNFSIGSFYPEDPLWDGEGCGSTSTCCEYNEPPWFCKQLLDSTRDDIELRICNEEETSVDDTPLKIVELYIY